MSYLKVFGWLMALYLLFAAGSWCVPDAPVKYHIAKTIERGDLADDQPRAFLPRLQCRMDNYTDALILNQAYFLRSENLVNGTMLVPRLTCERLPFEELRVAVGMDTASDKSVATYARYWHHPPAVFHPLLPPDALVRSPFVDPWELAVGCLRGVWVGMLLCFHDAVLAAAKYGTLHRPGRHDIYSKEAA